MFFESFDTNDETVTVGCEKCSDEENVNFESFSFDQLKLAATRQDRVSVIFPPCSSCGDILAMCLRFMESPVEKDHGRYVFVNALMKKDEVLGGGAIVKKPEHRASIDAAMTSIVQHYNDNSEISKEGEMDQTIKKKTVLRPVVENLPGKPAVEKEKV